MRQWKHGGGVVWPDDDIILSAWGRVEEIRHRPARLFKALLPAETALLLVDVRVRDIESLNAHTCEGIQHLERFRYLRLV
jgi:hypothetical protein